MNRIAKSIAAAALTAGFGVAGIATAQASDGNTTDTTTTGGAQSKRSDTNGSTAIQTSPRTKAKVNTYDSGLLWNPIAD